MTETWLDKESKGLIPKPMGYYVYHKIRTKNKKAWRSSGGISIFIRNSIREGIQIIPTRNSYTIWCKLRKKFFHLEKDVYIGTTYIPPKNSSYYNQNNNDPYEELHNEIQEFKMKGNIIIQGDFNARTKELEDIIIDDEDKLQTNLPIPDTYIYDTNIKKRRNADTWKNEFGEELVRLCKTNHLRIINGRTPGDWSGKLTCYSYHGASTVDYSIASEELLKSIIHFEVQELHTTSDHCPNRTILKTQSSYKENMDINKNLQAQTPSKYQWNTINKELYKIYMKTKESEDIANTFLKNYNNSKESDEIAHEFQTLIDKFANKCSIHKKVIKKSQQNKVKFTDRQCNMMKKELQTLSKMLQTNPTDGKLRIMYYTKKKKFKKYTKENSSIKEIPYTAWIEHFQKISRNDTTPIERIKEIEDRLLQLEKEMDNNHELNKPITLQEIIHATRKLKNNKATGPDGIPGELLKYSNKIVKQALQQMYNHILETGIYPQSWNTNVITPVHKTGDKMDVNNYRGISVSNIIAKIFSSIINKRISSYLESNFTIHPKKAGFRNKHRTTDHILTLHTINKKYQLRKEKIFCCFVDLRKCVDTVWRTALQYKLLKNNINGQVYNIMKMMYKNMDFVIKLGDVITPHFKIDNGVKQGCPLSPTLFNIFMNDFIEGLSNIEMPAPDLDGKHINCLQYADDIALLSTTN
ncbi:uncharacterized protein LOC144344539, partial [Saccoglossus kowalevskii]